MRVPQQAARAAGRCAVAPRRHAGDVPQQQLQQQLSQLGRVDPSLRGRAIQGELAGVLPAVRAGATRRYMDQYTRHVVSGLPDYVRKAPGEGPDGVSPEWWTTPAGSDAKNDPESLDALMIQDQTDDFQPPAVVPGQNKLPDVLRASVPEQALMLRRKCLLAGAGSSPHAGLGLTYKDEELLASLDRFRARNGFGWAMSASQIGHNQQAIALHLGEAWNMMFTGWRDYRAARPWIMHNPIITWRSEEMFSCWDYCHSYPDELYFTWRHESISIEFMLPGGMSRTMMGLPRVISALLQHQMDLLDGVLMADRSEHKISRAEFDADPGKYLQVVDWHLPPYIGQHTDHVRLKDPTPPTRNYHSNQTEGIRAPGTPDAVQGVRMNFGFAARGGGWASGTTA